MVKWRKKLENCDTVIDIKALLMLAGVKHDSVCRDRILSVVERAVAKEHTAGLERAAVICENIELQSHEIRFTTKSNWVEIIKLDVAAAIRKEKTSNRYPLLSFGDNGYGRMCMLIEVLKERWMKD